MRRWHYSNRDEGVSWIVEAETAEEAAEEFRALWDALEEAGKTNSAARFSDGLVLRTARRIRGV